MALWTPTHHVGLLLFFLASCSTFFWIRLLDNQEKEGEVIRSVKHEGAGPARCQEAHQAYPVWSTISAGDCWNERAGSNDKGHV